MPKMLTTFLVLPVLVAVAVVAMVIVVVLCHPGGNCGKLSRLGQ